MCGKGTIARNHLQSITMLSLISILLALIASSNAAKREQYQDPRDCEVCISNLERIEALVPADKKHNKEAIESAIFKHCTLSGFGSEWKPNPALTSPKVITPCYRLT
jgi:hypothetical protein